MVYLEYCVVYNCIENNVSALSLCVGLLSKKPPRYNEYVVVFGAFSVLSEFLGLCKCITKVKLKKSLLPICISI